MKTEAAAKHVNLAVTIDLSSVSAPFPFSPQHASFFYRQCFILSFPPRPVSPSTLFSAFHLSLFVHLSCTSAVVSFLMGGPGWSLLSDKGGNASLVSQ